MTFYTKLERLVFRNISFSSPWVTIKDYCVLKQSLSSLSKWDLQFWPCSARDDALYSCFRNNVFYGRYQPIHSSRGSLSSAASSLSPRHLLFLLSFSLPFSQYCLRPPGRKRISFKRNQMAWTDYAFAIFEAYFLLSLWSLWEPLAPRLEPALSLLNAALPKQDVPWTRTCFFPLTNYHTVITDCKQHAVGITPPNSAWEKSSQWTHANWQQTRKGQYKGVFYRTAMEWITGILSCDFSQ